MNPFRSPAEDVLLTDAATLKCPETRQQEDQFERELAALQGAHEEEDSPKSAAPPNRIMELNSTLSSLGSEICTMLQPSAEKVSPAAHLNDLKLVQELVILHFLLMEGRKISDCFEIPIIICPFCPSTLYSLHHIVHPCLLQHGPQHFIVFDCVVPACLFLPLPPVEQLFGGECLAACG